MSGIHNSNDHYISAIIDLILTLKEGFSDPQQQQQYLSYYWPEIDQTSRTGFWDQLQQQQQPHHHHQQHQ